MKPRHIQLLALLGCAVLIAAAATRIPAINEGRKTLDMLGSTSPLKNAPPQYAFAIQAFGAFRSLITDLAFIRAEQFKEQGKFYDAMQLATWICNLQPHFPSVWEFASWNMAWNISVTTFTPEERWSWVYNGVKLLRDEGIPLNPRAVNLYKQLAWTFNNKMGDTLDDFHYTYKCNWAWRMHLVLGPPPDPLAEIVPAELTEPLTSLTEADKLEEAARLTREQNEQERVKKAQERGQEYVPPPPVAPAEAQVAAGPSSFEISKRAARERMTRIDAAPKTLEKLYEAQPEARRMVGTLREDNYWRPDGLAFTFFAPYRRYQDPAAMLGELARGADAGNEERARGQKIDEILGGAKGDPAGRALLHFLQKKVLTEVYKLDPGHMAYLIDNFGPMDWRAVDAQGLYWASQGLVQGGGTLNDFRNDKTNTARIIYFCLRCLLLRGRVVFEPFPDRIYLSYLNLQPDLNFIEPMHQAYVKYGRLFDPDPGQDRGAGETYRTGHINFLTEAVRLLYLSGREAEAAHYYRYLQDTYSVSPAGDRNPAFAKSLHDYVMDTFLESVQVASQRDATLVINGLLSRAYDELGTGNVTSYVSLIGKAREFHQSYNKDKQDALSQSRALHDFTKMQTDAFFDKLALPAYQYLQTLQKARLWRVAPLFLRQAVHDALLPGLTNECNAWDFDVARAFPEPPGMKEYRQQHPARYLPEREGETDTLPQTLNQ
jgi:hypothetical protein